MRSIYLMQCLVILIVVSVGCRHQSSNNNPTIFSVVDSKSSGINSSNDLKEEMNTLANVLDFDFFYNGAGVGVGDFNNDGLQDLFFAGNQVDNQLYLNEGDLKFKNISVSAGISGAEKWCNGVSIIDINQDGFDDIYVSVGGPTRVAAERQNLLYINNKDLTFTESGQAYGLGDTGFSTQTLFTDYDNDGDLDAFVGNESYLYGYDPLTFFQKVGVSEEILHENCSHFYRNDVGKFVDVTKESGLLKPSFALGMISHDFNNDGSMDIYVANDYFIPDALYINQQDGSFVDETKKYFNQLAFFGMGVDIGDINTDGEEDVFVADMASADHVRSKTLMESMDVNSFRFLTEALNFPFQYMFNSVQLNDGTGKFNNVAHKLKLAKTDWSWSVDINDFNLDGANDIYVTNGYRRYAKHNDFRSKVNQIKAEYGDDVPLDVKQSLYDEMPSEALANFMYANESGTLVNSSEAWGLDVKTYSNGAVSVDLDNDGDLDIVVNNIDAKASLFENHVNDESKKSIKVTTDNDSKNYPFTVQVIHDDGSITVKSSKRIKGYFSSYPNEVIIAKASNIKEVNISWYDGKVQKLDNSGLSDHIVISKADAKGGQEKLTSTDGLSKTDIFAEGAPIHRENKFDDFREEVLLPYKQSTFGPLLSKSDEDEHTTSIYIGGSAGHEGMLYQRIGESFQKVDVSVFERDKMSEDMGSVFFDYDNDGDQDLYVVSGGNEFESGSLALRDRLYRNDGNHTYKRVRMQSIDELRHSGKVVKAGDFNNDGFQDLIIGNRMVPRRYPLPEPSYILWNRAGVFEKQALSELVGDYKDDIINDISLADVNGDNVLDMLLVGEWSAPKLLLSEEGSWTKTSALPMQSGLWFSSYIADLNGDGIQDIILGNIGENSKYSASSEKPLRIYAGDIDENGSWDMYLSKKWKGKFVPFRGKECSTEQMPFVSEKFPTYEGFAHAEINDIIGSEKVDELYQSEVAMLSSVILIGDGNGGYSSVKLPFKAQLLPILDIEVVQDSESGQSRVVLVGNIYDTEVETPRLDFHGGLVLEYKQDAGKAGIFEVTETLPYQGDAKSVLIVQLDNNKCDIAVGLNNGPVMTFEMK